MKNAYLVTVLFIIVFLFSACTSKSSAFQPINSKNISISDSDHGAVLSTSRDIYGIQLHIKTPEGTNREDLVFSGDIIHIIQQINPAEYKVVLAGKNGFIKPSEPFLTIKKAKSKDIHIINEELPLSEKALTVRSFIDRNDTDYSKYGLYIKKSFTLKGDELLCDLYAVNRKGKEKLYAFGLEFTFASTALTLNDFTFSPSINTDFISLKSDASSMPFIIASSARSKEKALDFTSPLKIGTFRFSVIGENLAAALDINVDSLKVIDTLDSSIKDLPVIVPAKGTPVVMIQSFVGDFNKDGSIDGTDLSIFQAAYFANNTAVDIYPAQDTDKDGFYDISTGDMKITVDDLIVFAANYSKKMGFPTYPYPENLTVKTPLDTKLKWEYFGTASPSSLRIHYGNSISSMTNEVPASDIDLASKTATLPLLSEDKSYYWQVSATYPAGEVHSEIWKFSTNGLPKISVNRLGSKEGTAIPSGLTDVAISNIPIYWSAPDSDGDTVTCTIKLFNSSDYLESSEISSAFSETTQSSATIKGPLLYNKDYFIQIRAEDSSLGVSVLGNAASPYFFRTKEGISLDSSTFPLKKAYVSARFNGLYEVDYSALISSGTVSSSCAFNTPGLFPIVESEYFQNNKTDPQYMISVIGNYNKDPKFYIGQSHVLGAFDTIPASFTGLKEEWSVCALTMESEGATKLFIGTSSNIYKFPDITDLSNFKKLKVPGIDDMEKKGNYLYLACKSANRLLVVDTSGDMMIKASKAIGSPIDLKVNGDFLYVLTEGKTLFKYSIVSPELLIDKGNITSVGGLSAVYKLAVYSDSSAKAGYVCCGSGGLKVIDLEKMTEAKALKDVEAKDAVVRGKLLFVISENSIYFYSLMEPMNPQLIKSWPVTSNLSTIKVW